MSLLMLDKLICLRYNLLRDLRKNRFEEGHLINVALS